MPTVFYKKEALPCMKAKPGSLHPAGSTAATVKTNFSGTMVQIAVGSQEVWLTRDEALAVCDALPSAINHMPVKI